MTEEELAEAMDTAVAPCHEWAFDYEARERYCIHCGVTDTDPPTAIRFATCPVAPSLVDEPQK